MFYRKNNNILCTAAAATTALMFAIVIPQAQALLLEMDEIPDLPLKGNATTLGSVDAVFNAAEGFLPANGTLTVPITGATDIDFNSMVPAGMTVIVDNQSMTVTSNPVSIGAPATAAAAGTDSGGGDSGGGDEGD
jgi:hypothetical protein